MDGLNLKYRSRCATKNLVRENYIQLFENGKGDYDCTMVPKMREELRKRNKVKKQDLLVIKQKVEDKKNENAIQKTLPGW